MGIFSFLTSTSNLVRQATRGRKRSRKLEMVALEERCVPTSASQSITFVSQQTGGISAPALFNQFNPNLGVLQSITIAQTGSITSDIKVENTSTLSAASITATVAGSMSLTGGGVNQNITLNPISETFAATMFDGTLDFGGTSGTDFGNQTASGSNSSTLTGTQMTPFEGTGTIGLNESSTAGSNATSNVGNLALVIASNATATVTITYNYTPNNASISGFVYMDANDNGTFDSSESGIAGVTLTLTGTTSQGMAVNQTTTTTTGGAYSFTGLAAGTYSVAETPPANYLNGTDSLGSLGATNGKVSANDLSSIVVAQGNAGVNYNFGELLPASISGFAYLDANADGVMDAGDKGISGVTVTLTGTSDQGPVIMPATTGTDGSYSFTNLRPGTYTVTESPPSGYLPGTDNVGSLGGTVGASQFTAVVAAAGSQGTQYNFGELTPTDDVAIVKTASAPSVPEGSQLTYTMTITTDGASTANGVSVSDPLPTGETYVSSAGTGWTITDTNGTVTATTPTLAVGASSSFTITVTVPDTVGSITNTATVSSTTPDTNPNNNQSSVTTTITPMDDVSIVKTASASSVTVGSQLTYTLAITNNGPSEADGVSVSDPLPAGETYISALGPGWTITDTNNTVTATTATLPVGVTSTFTITVTVPNTAGAITNTGTVTSTTPDSNPNNNQSTVTTLVTDVPGTTTTQNIPPVQFAAAPVFTKTQLVGGSLNATLTADADYVESIYLTLTGSAPSATTVSNDVFQMEMGRLTKQQLVTQLYFSGQFIDQEITSIYQSVLGTAPTSSELSTAAAELQGGASLTSLEAGLLTSSAYLQAHTTPGSLIAGLDEAVMGGTPALSSMNLQIQSLGTTTWNAYVQSQLASTAALTQIVAGDYEEILGRAPTTTELNAWVGAMQNGQATPDTLSQQLFASSEFLQRAYQNA
jgi:uncharacterized repeat protein (TIGR01451 family)